MTTTKRTAIRRRLAVGGRSYRPPTRRGQGLGHGVILARPSRGTLAATVVVGVTIGLAALARAERNRRALRPRPASRDRHFGLLPHETPARGLKRITLSQLDLAIELLRGEGAVPAPERVHETRKALKRVRALLRLLEDELGRKRSARAQAVLRDAAAGLAETRDAEVMVGTLEQLLRRHPRRLRRRRALIELREALERERQTPGVAAAPASNGSAATAGRSGNAYAGEHAEIAADLAALRARVEGWDLRDRSLERLVQPGLRRVYREGRARWTRAAARKPSPSALHRWRKEVKDLRYVLEVLDVPRSTATLVSPGASVSPGPSANAGAPARQTRPAGRERPALGQARTARRRARRTARPRARSRAAGRARTRARAAEAAQAGPPGAAADDRAPARTSARAGAARWSTPVRAQAQALRALGASGLSRVASLSPYALPSLHMRTKPRN